MTPLMRQYWDIKAAHEDKVLLFRMGDFFEMFHEDAVKAAPIIGIALTQRNKKSADETPMCGVPHHSIAGPINKLLKAGLKVAMCDQIEDPKLAKGLVKRAVTRVLTPGMVYDPETLNQQESNYLACAEDEVLACVDTSTGESFYLSGLAESEIKRLISLLPIVELVVADKEAGEQRAKSEYLYHGLVSPQASLDSETDPQLPVAAQRLLAYIQSLSGKEGLKTLRPFESRQLQKRMELSPTVVRHLEIFANYKGSSEGSLFEAIDRTKTSGGARKLKQWISFPLLEKKEIEARFDQVQKWTQDLAQLKRLREVLALMGDIERRLGKIAQPQSNARDLQAMADAIGAGLSALEIAGENLQAFNSLQNLQTEIMKTIVDEPPLLTRQGHLIRQGYSSELDELIELATNGQSLLQKMEEQEKAKTGISSLKIRYNSVFGFYIEVTNTHKDKVPAHYMRKQTLTNAERYCTDELLELEKKVLSSQSKRADLEYAIFENLRQKCLATSSSLLQLASLCSELDVHSSFAWLSIEAKLVRPQFQDSGSLSLKASRHLVVERSLQKMKSGSFVANDISLDAGGCLLLTGPNMAGKSTLMRQIAITAIMAQTGCFVPADEAKIPLFDHIFTRIGASDQLTEGLSTFMVEMTEAAEMLEKSTNKSLMIVDEIGRGTSTFDGMSLAQSILEYILTRKAAMTIFATHYHELTVLEEKFPQLKNAHMTVSERGGEIKFLHTLKQGPAQKSYGIQVAKLAGLPEMITVRAQALLDQKVPGPVYGHSAADKSVSAQLTLMDQLPQKHPIIDEIMAFAVQTKTPLETMNQVAKWQNDLKSSDWN